MEATEQYTKQYTKSIELTPDQTEAVHHFPESGMGYISVVFTTHKQTHHPGVITNNMLWHKSPSDYTAEDLKRIRPMV